MRRFGLLILGLAVAAPAWAESPRDRGEKTGEEQGAKLSAEEQDAVRQLHQLARHMDAVARIGERRGTSDDVKSLAANVGDTFGKLTTELSQWANEQKLDLTAMPEPARYQTELDELRGLEGSAFDRSFQDLVAMSSREVISSIESVVDQSDNTSFKQKMNNYLNQIERYAQGDNPGDRGRGGGRGE